MEIDSMIKRIAAAGALLVLGAASAVAQQATAPAPAGPAVGETAPDFTAPGADRSGTLSAPIRLSDFKGKTVVLAFFPAARTGGCTMQLTQYKDQYEKLFNGGKDVVLLGISTDPDTTLANWAKEAGFPFRFVSDSGRAIGLAYGTLSEARKTEARDVFVIGPDGKIAYTKKRFSPATPAHYEELGAEVHKTIPHSHK
jgi:peroxiredoxin Q/BCP